MSEIAASRDQSSLEAVATGVSDDPFAVLGWHRVPSDAGNLSLVRTMQPSAERVEVLVNERVVPMLRRHPDGLFEASWPEAQGGAKDYRLRVHAHGTSVDIDDPYRFGQLLSDYDLHLFSEGTLFRAWEHLGARRRTIGGTSGVHFAVWAPNAQRVSVVGDFNGWDGRMHPMRKLIPSGVWEVFLPGVPDGSRYKYELRTSAGQLLLKSDPFGRRFELPPQTASIVDSDSTYWWRDEEWVRGRAGLGGWHSRPMSTYEIHAGSWRRADDGTRNLTYRELADTLVPYLRDMGYTHVELMPIMEHPFTASWGYQVIGFYAPTSRFGSPDDFRYFVDECHMNGIGVILDWVPGHFPKDEHGLAWFDGTALYEHADPRMGEHQDWGTLIFNYGRNEVRTFLLSNALYWLEEFHLDGLRVDAVASMLYLDYSRKSGEWIPNQYGGRENLDAVDFLKQLNIVTHGRVPGTIMIAEESTSWPGVSRPVYTGGLGFSYKWNMGWMHDMLDYVEHDPVYRRWLHNSITFSMLYAFTENFVLPFSHDEVVHGKRSLADKIPGDSWQKQATLRALFGYMFGHPGKKLMFMGSEFGQWREWNHDTSLDWHLLDYPGHAGLQRWVRDLNNAYRDEPALYEVDNEGSGFSWIDCHDHENSVVSLLRRAKDPDNAVVIIANFTPVPRYEYKIGVPGGGWYREILNSDAGVYGGSNVGNDGGVWATPEPRHDLSHTLTLTLPPLSCMMFKR
ncbi:MAG: 1,4-alpha-glucan branching protein GlgB [Vicinamibacterales bacterium]